MGDGRLGMPSLLEADVIAFLTLRLDHGRHRLLVRDSVPPTTALVRIQMLSDNRAAPVTSSSGAPREGLLCSSP